MARRMAFENGEPAPDCDHDDIVDRPGARPVCRNCDDVVTEEEKQ